MQDCGAAIFEPQKRERFLFHSNETTVYQNVMSHIEVFCVPARRCTASELY